MARFTESPAAQNGLNRHRYCCTAVGIYRRNGRLVTTALLFGLGPLVIGILKATSAHSCPWDLVEYGGKALNYVLMDTAPPGAGPGHCFPGGHASSGFAVMALFFLVLPRTPTVGDAVLVRRYWTGYVDGFRSNNARGAFSYS